MKRILTLCLVLVSIASFAGATIKVETETWLDANTVQVSTSSSPELNPGGSFFLGRAYLTLIGDLGTDFYGDPIKERVTFDFANATSSGAAGIIKYAYFDYTLLKNFWDPNGGQKFLVFSAGLIPVYFGNIQFWQYVLPIKDATELYKGVSYTYGYIPSTSKPTNYTGIAPTASADFGLMLSGKFLPIEGLTSSLISYYLQFLNGEGYKTFVNNNGAPYINASTNGSDFAYQASAFVSPIDGTMIGGTYRIDSYDDATIGTGVHNTETSYALLLSARNVMNIPVDFTAQYISETSTNDWLPYSVAKNNTTPYGYDFTGVVYSISLGYGFLDWAIEPMIRYDYYNPDTTVSNGQNGTDVSGSILYIGASFKPDPNLTIKPMYGMYMTENGKPSQNYLVWLEFAYKLNFTIWQ